MVVKKGSLVKFHLTGKFGDGKEFISTTGKEPFQCRVGEEKLAKGIEEGLIGMRESEKKEIIVPPDKGFGWRDEGLIKKMPRNILEGRNVEVGQLIRMKDGSGKLSDVTILEIETDTVTLDLNHPLAGKTVKFDVEVVEVQ